MEKYWPDLKNRTHPETFWKSEHAKHGICFDKFQDQVVYFQTALDIAKDIGDMMSMRLRSGSIYLRYTFFLSFCNSLFTIEKR